MKAVSCLGRPPTAAMVLGLVDLGMGESPVSDPSSWQPHPCSPRPYPPTPSQHIAAALPLFVFYVVLCLLQSYSTTPFSYHALLSTGCLTRCRILMLAFTVPVFSSLTRFMYSSTNCYFLVLVSNCVCYPLFRSYPYKCVPLQVGEAAL